MFKTLFKTMGDLLTAYAAGVLALWAEFGSQTMVPGFQANSSYATLGATRYIVVGAVGAYQAVQATDQNSSLILGVMQNTPAIGEAMSIACAGLSKIVAGAVITANDILTTNGSGRAIKVTSGDMAIGRALEAAGADGDVITAMLFHPVRWAEVA